MSEKRTIKIWDGINLITSEGVTFCESPAELWEHINCTDEQKTDIIRHLYCFHHLDLTEACGKLCALDVVPANSKEA